MKSKGIWNKVPGILFGLAAVFAFFAVFAEGFASMYNMQNLLKDCSLLIDQSKLFKGTVVKQDRSLMNVPFVTGDEEMDALFVKESKAAGLENLKGHRTVGGMRASIYNAMPMEGVKKLVEFMDDFETRYGK